MIPLDKCFLHHSNSLFVSAYIYQKNRGFRKVKIAKYLLKPIRHDKQILSCELAVHNR